jgi:hypothetical protein
MCGGRIAVTVQVSQQAASEFHILHEMAIERCKSLLLLIDPHLSFHVVENAGLTGGRNVEDLPAESYRGDRCGRLLYRTDDPPAGIVRVPGD